MERRLIHEAKVQGVHRGAVELAKGSTDRERTIMDASEVFLDFK